VSDQQNNPSEGSSGVPRDLERALGDWSVSAARPEFRERQRRAFLAAGKAGPGVSEAETVERLEAWGSSPARGEFREQLRARFLEAAADYTPATSSAATGPAPVPEAQSEGDLPSRPILRFPQVIGSLVAVAAALLLYFNLTPEPIRIDSVDRAVQGWQPVNLVDGASFLLDGSEELINDDARLRDAFAYGDCSLSVGRDNLAMIHYGEGVLLEFPPSTTLRFLPRSEGEVGLIEIEVLTGGLRVATTDAFAGRILVYTPHTVVALSGHSLGIDVLPKGTCLCVQGGSAQVKAKKGDADSNAYSLGSHSTTFFTSGGQVREFPVGEVHHADEMDEFSALGEKYLY
jgi:hypothetical protein